MIKILNILALVLILVLNSCNGTIEPEYNNTFDPKSENYLPTAPINISLSFSYQPLGIKIYWIDKSFGEIKFEIERSISLNNFIKVGEIPADSNLYIDSFVPQLNRLYYYRIKVVSKNGNYSYSPEKAFLTNIFNAPTSLKIVHLSKTSIKLTWVDQSSYEDGYHIGMRNANDTTGNFDLIGTVGKNISEFLIENPDTNKIYEFNVTAFNTYYSVECDTTISAVFGMELLQHWQSTNYLYSQISKFSPINNLLALGGWPETENISVYNVSTFEYQTTNFSHSYLGFNAAGTKLGLLENWSSANPISIVDINTLNIDKVINVPATGFSFSPDGLNIFIWNENNLILRLVDLSTSNSIWSKNISQIYDAKFNYAGDKIYRNTGTQVLILNPANGNIVGSITPSGYIVSFVITNDEKYLYIVNSTSNPFFGESIIIWDIQSSSIVKMIDSYACIIEISPDQNYVAIGNSDFAIFRTSDFEKVGNINPSWGGRIFSLSFNPYSSLISVNSEYDHPKVFSLNRKWIKRFK